METTVQSINVKTTRWLELCVNETRVTRWNRDRNGPFKDEVTTVNGTRQNIDKKLLEPVNLFIALIRYRSVNTFELWKSALLVLLYVLARFYRAVDELARFADLLHTVTRYFSLSLSVSLFLLKFVDTFYDLVDYKHKYENIKRVTDRKMLERSTEMRDAIFTEYLIRITNGCDGSSSSALNDKNICVTLDPLR